MEKKLKIKDKIRRKKKRRKRWNKGKRKIFWKIFFPGKPINVKFGEYLG